MSIITTCDTTSENLFITNKLVITTRGCSINCLDSSVEERQKLIFDLHSHIGLFTIVAVTGLEIKDACATMEDLRELNGLLDTGEDIDTGKVCGLDIPDLDTVIDKVKKSPKAAYESARSVDVLLPSWSDVNAIIKRGWGGILKNLDWIWKWLFGG